MDLTERGDGETRHPWEVQRYEAYRRILADHGALGSRRVLDVGAGDGWFSGRLTEQLPGDAVVTCWDVNYDDADLADEHPGQVRTRERPTSDHDLVLFLDVMEHIADPQAFILSELRPILRPGTPMLLSVPAHQRLYSSHDEALGHHRRYGRREFLDEIGTLVDVVDDGSLFTCLLLPRAATVVLERVRRQDDAEHGVGRWSGGRTITSVVGGVLAADARVGRSLGRIGVRLPGLSHWAFGVVR